MTVEVVDVDPAAYEPHALHRQERIWVETNCYVDLWIEVLHALGLDPLAAAAFTLSTDFEGDQWTFFKYPPEDLRAVYGIDVAEMNVWRPVEEHVVEQLELGRLLTVEVDAFHLPDTAEISYRIQHTKTTIVPNRVDPESRRVGYFHNAGYFELEGDDYLGALRIGLDDDRVLVPYIETVKLDGIERGPADLVDRAMRLTTDHLRRRPATNPVTRMRKRLTTDLEWLASRSLDDFHRWAFGTCRQCGSSAEIAAAFVDWLTARTGAPIGEAAVAYRDLATDAKALQFALARLVRGRSVDADPILDRMADCWERATATLVEGCG